MLHYKDYIVPNLGVFFRHKNNIDVFIEDNYDEEFYKVIINRILGNGYRVSKLISLCGKTNVINACQADQFERKEKRIYIVDGDLELITDGNKYNLKYLFIHRVYCIENYLFDKNSIIDILHEHLVIERNKIEKTLSFENWLKGISQPLIDMFLHYALCKKYSPSSPTISIGVGNLCKQMNKITVLDAIKVNDRIEILKQEIINSSTEEIYTEEIYNLRQKWNISVETLLKIVSAKDYLMTLLQFRFQKFHSIKKVKIRNEELRFRLAKTCNLDELKELKRII